MLRLPFSPRGNNLIGLLRAGVNFSISHDISWVGTEQFMFGVGMLMVIRNVTAAEGLTRCDLLSPWALACSTA